MIRLLCPEDIETTASIWLDAAIKSHHFISEEYWVSQQQNMRDIYLTHSESWVYEDSRGILGFVSYHKGSIPAIFVEPYSQSRGIGTQLLEVLKSKYSELDLCVYLNNDKARQFYLRHGFRDWGQSLCEYTGYKKVDMYWQR